MAIFDAYNSIGQSRNGKLIYNKNDDILGRSIELYGEYAEREKAVFDQIIRPEHVVVEIGANIGAHTIFLATKVGPTGRVLAFEMQRLIFQTLCGNIALNSITNTHCWNMAVGAEPGEIVVPPFNPRNPSKTPPIDANAPLDGEIVPVVAIDNLNLPRCDFIKIGFAGSSGREVLTGAAKTISRLKPVLYINQLQDQEESLLFEHLDSNDYSMHWHEVDLFNPENVAGNSENIFAGQRLKNLLCIDKAAMKHLTGFEEASIHRAA